MGAIGDGMGAVLMVLEVKVLGWVLDWMENAAVWGRGCGTWGSGVSDLGYGGSGQRAGVSRSLKKRTAC